MKRQMDTRYMATLAMLSGVLLVMGMTGIGFIPLPVIKATTMHIPVILGAILLGPGAGAVLGAVFGLCSIWVNTATPGLMSFAFSPFMSTEGLAGVAKSPTGVNEWLLTFVTSPVPAKEPLTEAPSLGATG